MNSNRGLDYTALVITVIGAIVWGLIGLFNWNLVSALFGSGSWLSRIIYVVVGVCGLYTLSFLGRVTDRSEV